MNLRGIVAHFLPPKDVVPIEIAIGRWLALCRHPFIAWRVLPLSGRMLILASYAASSYAAVLLALLALEH